MDYPEDHDRDKRRLEDAVNELEDVTENLEESVDEQSSSLETVETREKTETKSRYSVTDRMRTGANNIRNRFSTSADQEDVEDKDIWSRRKTLGVLGAGAAAALGIGAAYTVFAEEDYDLTVDDANAIDAVVDEYRFSQDENLASIGRDLEDAIENEDRDYQLGFSDTVLDNTIHLNADGILQREYSDLDAVTYSQAEGIAEEMKEEYQGD